MFTSYRRIVIVITLLKFHWITFDNHEESSISLKQAQRYKARNDVVEREIGGAAGIHIILCGENKPLIKVKKNA